MTSPDLWQLAFWLAVAFALWRWLHRPQPPRGW